MKTEILTKKIQKNFKLYILGLIGLILFRKYIIQIILFLIFGVIGMQSLKVTRMVPHVSVETITASSILFGYVWGWKLGFSFGVCFGIFGYIQVSMLKDTTILNSLFMGFCGILGDLFHSMGMTFVWAFVLAFVIRSNLGFLVYSIIKPDIIENLMHSYGDALFNVLIVMQLMSFIHGIIQPFVVT